MSRSAAPPPASPEDDRVWRALAEPRRRALLDHLAGGPATTGELVERLPDLCRTAVMKHLDVLEEAGLLVVVREGRLRWNHLDPAPLGRLRDGWLATHVAGTAARLARLKDHVEGRRRPRRPPPSPSPQDDPR